MPELPAIASSEENRDRLPFDGGKFRPGFSDTFRMETSGFFAVAGVRPALVITVTHLALPLM
jgi:hypothetical protein